MLRYAEACVRDQNSGFAPVLCCRCTSQRQGVQKVIDDVMETLPYLGGSGYLITLNTRPTLRYYYVLGTV